MTKSTHSGPITMEPSSPCPSNQSDEVVVIHKGDDNYPEIDDKDNVEKLGPREAPASDQELYDKQLQYCSETPCEYVEDENDHDDLIFDATDVQDLMDPTSMLPGR